MLLGVWGSASLLAACSRPPGEPARTDETPPKPPGAASASAPVGSGDAATTNPAPPRIDFKTGGPAAVESSRGLVVSVESHATKAGVSMLERGGNAVDAAVAVGYALAVTHPSAGNIGGGGFMLIKMRAAETTAVEFRERAPAGLDRKSFDAMIEAKAVGAAASGVPGTVAGLNLAHRKFGRLSRADVLAPAIRLARRGHRVGHREALTFGWNWRKLRRDREARRIFGDAKGRPKKAGALLLRPDLARTLEAIAERGDAGFYRGEVADRLVAAMGKKGLITRDDLAGYEARIREPLRFRYRGLAVDVAPPPSAGGVAVAQTLLVMDRARAAGKLTGGADDVHWLIEALKRAHAERRFEVGDPDALSPERRAALRRRWLDAERLFRRTPAIGDQRATPSSELHPLYEGAMKELEHTTHFSVADAEGNAVSCTTTLSAGFGAKLVVPGTGIVLNNSVAAFGTVGENQPAPGRRMTSSMAPTIASEGRSLRLVLGSPGGDTIPGTVVQVLRNVVDYSMTIDRAVEAPRLHHGFVPDEVRFEHRRPPSKTLLAELERRGHRLSKKGLPLGDANNILVVGGVAWGVADSREGGLALAPAEQRSKPGGEGRVP